MVRNLRNETEVSFLLNLLIAVGEGAPTVEEKLRLVQTIRGNSKNASQQLDQFLVEELSRLHLGLAEAREAQEKLKPILEKLTAPPLHPAIYLGTAATGGSQGAMVMMGNARRVVAVADNIDLDSLAVGDEVLLGNELNVVVSKSPCRVFQSGETAFFERYTPDRHLVLKSRDEEVVVDVAGPLREVELKSGDQIRWDRNVWMAFEKIERSAGTNLFLEETPQETFADIGGLDHRIEELQQFILLQMNHADVASKYRVRRKGSILLVGPPGVGKTMLTRALANWLATLSRSGRSRFMNIKPAGLHSMWYSQSEANYRETFRIAREAGLEEPEIPVVMFFDEVDAIGAVRGESLMRADDRVLLAFANELDGLEARGNILVVAATNRRDTLDPALVRPGRLGDWVVEVPRPNRQAAREIFAKHLPADLPYAGNGHGQDIAATHQEIIDAAVSQIYAPNGSHELATITFRDGKRRIVKASDLISGASIAKIAMVVRERACLREVKTGQPGIQWQDLRSAIAEECESAVRVLTPANCRNYLSDLPHDVDVVRVELLERKVSRPHRYLSVA